MLCQENKRCSSRHTSPYLAEEKGRMAKKAVLKDKS